MPEYKLIALDLDGTLLDPDKNLTRENYAALEKAANDGLLIVPTTGRFYPAMPESIRSLPFVRYVIAVNGARVTDTKTGEVLYQAEIPADEAVEIMTYLDTLPVIYDCFMNDAAYMSRCMWDRIPDFAPDKHYYKMLRELRQPVDDLKAFLREGDHSIQKTQFFFRDMALRRRLLRELPDRFPRHTVTSSVVNNIEITHKNANKGRALAALAERLGLGLEQTLAFGDDLNDVPMLETAGLGFAMANAGPEAKAAADRITLSNAENGVAAALQAVLWDGKER